MFPSIKNGDGLDIIYKSDGDLIYNLLIDKYFVHIWDIIGAAISIAIAVGSYL